MLERNIRKSRVCVIGGAGFLGSHLVNHLIEDRECEVLVLDNLLTGLTKHINANAKFLWWDIRGEPRFLADVLARHKIQYVFNYAAEPYIPECYERPAHFFDINAVAVLNVLTACDDAGVSGVLQVSSAEIYGDSTGKMTEDAPIHPHSTYGVAKMAADGLVQVRWKEARTPAIALRQFNCVGERETHPYVIPEIISQLHTGVLGRVPPDTNPVTIKLGNNTNRDFLYAGDAVAMAVELLEKGRFGQVYNLGSEEVISIYNLAKLVGTLMPYDAPVTISEDPTRKRPWEIWHLQSDNSKIYDVIDGRPETTLGHALSNTIAYFIANKSKWDW